MTTALLSTLYAIVRTTAFAASRVRPTLSPWPPSALLLNRYGSFAMDSHRLEWGARR
ncbi:MAG TPA: hypothetical protein VI094_11545 [Propionibacteriaceae bacterium]